MAQGPRVTDPLILVVDDDLSLVSTLRTALIARGLRVLVAESGAETRALLEHVEPDLILLDVMLPDTDGLILAALLKRLRSTPIIIMSARTEQLDRVLGLKLGADDFLAKPFELDELMARVEAVLRRASAIPPAPADRIRIGQLTIVPSRALVTLGPVTVHLTPLEFRLLLTLAKHVDETVSRGALLELVWNYRDSGAGHVLDVHVARLRQKLRDGGLSSPRVVTVRGAGFKLISAPEPLLL